MEDERCAETKSKAVGCRDDDDKPLDLCETEIGRRSSYSGRDGFGKGQWARNGRVEAFWCDRVGSQGLVAGRTRLRMPSRRGRWRRQRGFNSTGEGRSRSRSPWAEHRQGE